jgi:hypothetical protein
VHINDQQASFFQHPAALRQSRERIGKMVEDILRRDDVEKAVHGRVRFQRTGEDTVSELLPGRFGIRWRDLATVTIPTLHGLQKTSPGTAHVKDLSRMGNRGIDPLA